MFSKLGQGREQAVPAHPALTAFVHPYTAGAEALQQELHHAAMRFLLRLEDE